MTNTGSHGISDSPRYTFTIRTAGRTGYVIFCGICKNLKFFHDIHSGLLQIMFLFCFIRNAKENICLFLLYYHNTTRFSRTFVLFTIENPHEFPVIQKKNAWSPHVLSHFIHFYWIFSITFSKYLFWFDNLFCLLHIL